jgi:hypothetical protein
MKKLIALSLLLAACHRAPSSAPTPANALGAADPKSAIGAFIAAINAQDLQAMSAVWGDADGSVRNQMNADELMKREVVMIQMLKCVRKDFTVISDAVASTTQRSMVVEMNFLPPSRAGGSTGNGTVVTRTTNIAVANDKSGRWYVSAVDLNKINDVCLARS